MNHDVIVIGGGQAGLAAGYHRADRTGQAHRARRDGADAYGVLAAFQPSHEFGRVLAAYGGVFIVGSLLWGVVFDGFHPDRADILGALVCLTGVGIIMYAR